MGSWWSGVHHSVRGELQGVPAPSRILTGYNPSSRHPARLVKTQTPAPLVSGFLPGLGGARGTRLCQGLVISSEDVSELLGLAGKITELFQLPIPPWLAFGKFPFSSLKSPWSGGWGWGCNHSSSDALPSWGRGCPAPVGASREQGSASGAPAGNWLLSTWKKKKYCYFLNAEARKHLGVSCLSSLLQGALSAERPFQPNPFFTHFLSPDLLRRCQQCPCRC